MNHGVFPPPVWAQSSEVGARARDKAGVGGVVGGAKDARARARAAWASRGVETKG